MAVLETLAHLVWAFFYLNLLRWLTNMLLSVVWTNKTEGTAMMDFTGVKTVVVSTASAAAEQSTMSPITIISIVMAVMMIACALAFMGVALKKELNVLHYASFIAAEATITAAAMFSVMNIGLFY